MDIIITSIIFLKSEFYCQHVLGLGFRFLTNTKLDCSGV